MGNGAWAIGPKLPRPSSTLPRHPYLWVFDRRSVDTRHESCVMSLAPLLNAASAIPLHAFAAMTAFALGVVQFAAPKGTLPHRTIGDLGLPDDIGDGQFVLDPSDPADRLLEPDPFAGDLHAGDGSTRRLEGAPASGRRSSPRHDPDFLRCAGYRRAVRAAPGADHAHRAVRPLATPGQAVPGEF